MLDELSLWIQVINYRVGVLRRTCGKDCDLIVSVCRHEKLISVRPDIETDIFDYQTARCCDVNPDIGLSQGIRLLDTMDECLVEIEQQKLGDIPLLKFNFNLFL